MPTVLHRLAKWSVESPDDIAQKFKVNGAWKSISAAQVCNQVHFLALFLESRGITREIGTIFSYNCPQWVQMELATLLLGAKSAGLYPNSNTKDIHYVLNHTETTFIAIQNKEYFQKICGDISFKLPERIKLIIVFDGDTSFSPIAVSFDDAVAQGKRLSERKESKNLSVYLSKLNPLEPSFLIYTSGTTGNP